MTELHDIHIDNIKESFRQIDRAVVIGIAAALPPCC